MNTRLVMMLSAIFLAAIGITFTFLPREASNFIGISSENNIQIILQILGALYFSFAMLNWTAKGAIIGGIYNKPIAIANFTHFVIGALTLLKAISNNPILPYFIWVLAGIYAVFAILFGVIFFKHPETDKK
jgi:hypothetical protein